MDFFLYLSNILFLLLYNKIIKKLKIILFNYLNLLIKFSSLKIFKKYFV